ncbi:GntR family transcriptional regulator [Ureibacillus acetophenoni]|uniref:GntR family transcriptional regulator n=1 Tax=Ureibacillus acetophenoni TaxID=614649 RepID=A0A285UQL8_9BACL|nr:GntR family transcriptional regulator [Ureibacillus acetophenoni]SOC43987.1 GntR family transcriptional regulator [Ureibacillus acetophenoni]
MMIQIEPDTDIPIYTQLTNQIIEGIARGHIKPGDSLPSVRSFAADLGVNMHTVNKSYHELEKKGIIQIVPKSGAVIIKHEGIDDVTYQKLKEDVKPHIAEAMVFGMTEEDIQQLVKSIIVELKEKN